MAEGEASEVEKFAEQATRGAIRGTREALRDLWKWFRGHGDKPADTPEAKRGILILGPGGTGKTTLARLLSGECDWLDESSGRYRESAGLESFGLSDDPDVELVVAPGQAYRRVSTWPALLAQVTAGEFRGVILMNAFGYHTFSTPSYRNHQLYKGSKPEFMKAFVDDRRQDEIRVLNQLVPRLASCSQKIWMLSVVAKQDLWGSQQRAAEEHYERGPYANELATVSKSLGDQSFRHECVFVSLVIRSLETLAGERLQDNEAGYDMPRWAHSIRHLVNVFTALRTWEGDS